MNKRNGSARSKSGRSYGMIFFAVFLSTVVGLLLSTAEANPSCGATLSGVTVTLDSNLSCSDSPALTLNGGVTLNLNGKILSCTSNGFALALSGKRNVVKNGVVSNCSVGIDIRGIGQNKVLNMTISNNTGPGMQISSGSSRNLIKRNTITNNGGTGINVSGGSTLNNGIIENTVNNNSGNGIDLGGAGSTVRGNTTNGNGIDGIAAGSGNSISGNTSTGNTNFGLRILDCDNTISRNIASTNGTDFAGSCFCNVWRNNTPNFCGP